MTFVEGNLAVTEVLEHAERKRLVAQAVAELHYVDTALELGTVIADDGLPFGEGEATTAHGSRNFYLEPVFQSREDAEDNSYAGFRVKEAVPTGGASYTLIYDRVAGAASIGLKYAEFDSDGEVCTTTLENIENSEHQTQLFVNRAVAAALAIHTPAKDKAKFAAWAHWEQASQARWMRKSMLIPFADGLWVPESLRRLVRI